MVDYEKVSEFSCDRKLVERRAVFSPRDLFFRDFYHGTVESARRCLESRIGRFQVKNGEALRWVCCYGRVDLFELLLEFGADVGVFEGSPLVWASANGHVGVVRALLGVGVDVHVKDDAALVMASINGHVEVVKVLLGAGADVRAQGGGALSWACQKGYVGVVVALLEGGADVLGVGWEGLGVLRPESLASMSVGQVVEYIVASVVANDLG